MKTKIRKVIDAKTPFEFKIKPMDIFLAECGDPEKCVIAQALTRAFSDFFEGFQVGSTVTKIITSDKVIRYRTSDQLKSALRNFDKTGKWNLPVGQYVLPILSPAHRQGSQATKKRWENWRNGQKVKKKIKGTLTVFKARALPTRRVIRSNALVSV